MESALTTIASFGEPWEAHMLRGRLEAEGIPAIVTHEHHVWVNWPLSTALGGVRVQVPSAMREDARAIEIRCRKGEFKAELRAELGDIDDICCPNCGGTRFRKRRPARQIVFSLSASFLFALTPPWIWIRYCQNCGAKFEH